MRTILAIRGRVRRSHGSGGRSSRIGAGAVRPPAPPDVRAASPGAHPSLGPAAQPAPVRRASASAQGTAAARCAASPGVGVPIAA